jgi:ATP-binding cassette subfamily C protein
MTSVRRAVGSSGAGGAAARQPGVVAPLRDLRRAFRGVAVFSAAVNLLMLAGPLYMLQIYDRVLASRSVPTLIALSAASSATARC